ncbi:shikimate kinase [Listeria weihenstephanensis FSL R9-0317]|nr:shikimate kinase [Listeria weihenstephanensis]EUJ36531.1 shikimate kinase [Listeria weihenstephanensis FSL R9-0317]
MRQIVLTGFMGAGKTTVGKLLSQTMQLPIIDIDTEIQLEQQASITEIFANLGEVKFRELEHQMLLRVLQKDAVISTGGGIILSPENRAELTAANFVVYLKTQPDSFLSRLKGDTTRPLIQEKSAKEIKDLFESRAQLYENSAHLTIETDELTPQEIANQIQQYFQERKENI